LTLSIDANFGLCRKKNAGTSVREPLSGNSMFGDQGKVNDYVLSSMTESVPSATNKVDKYMFVCYCIACARTVVISWLAMHCGPVVDSQL